ncbi:MAG: hypothetical protein JOZ75_09025, partial [Candidatus Dormibacteraeota bacterium]|nr:hypothetical protein [Candidatus Dormibacteraeota bacterium]
MTAVPMWRRRIFTPRTAVVVTAFDLLIFAGFGAMYLSPITPPAVWHAAGGAVTPSVVLPFVMLAAIGGLIASRRPANWVGWAIILAATSLGIGAFFSLLSTVLLFRGIEAGRWVQIGGVFWTGVANPAFLGLTLALLLFPDGHLRSGRWRWLVYAELVLVALCAVAVLVNKSQGGLGITYVNIKGVDQPTPFAISALDGVTNALVNQSLLAEFVIVALAILSVFLRLRGADAEL